MATIANLPRISASRLSSLIIAESAAANPTLAVIDVRDDGMSTYLPRFLSWP